MIFGTANTLIQRFVEGAFHAGFQGVKNGVSGAARSPYKAKSWEKRAKSVGDALSMPQTRSAVRDAEYWMDRTTNRIMDTNRTPLQRTASVVGAVGMLPAKAAMSSLHIGVGVASDVVGGAAAIAGQAIGTTVGTGVRVAAGAGYMGAKVLGHAAMGTAKGANTVTRAVGFRPIPVAGHMAVNAAKDTIGVVGGTAKAIWQTRHNPVVGSAMVLGAAALGAGLGNGEHTDRMLFGDSDFQEYGAGVRGVNGKGYFNPQIQAGAWNFNQNSYSPAADGVQQSINTNGGYQTVNELNGPLGQGMGPTGDLVFALHATRNGGQI